MKKGKSKTAQLRVAVESDGKHALIAQANITGEDIYGGPPSRTIKGKKREIVRSSFHARGPTRLHRLGLPTLAGHLGMKPTEVEGAVMLAQGGPGGLLEWTYKVRADNSTRKTLVLPYDRRLAEGSCISYWAIESGVADPVNTSLQVFHPKALEVVGHVVSHWTVPQLMILVMVMSEVSIASLEAAIANK